MGCTSSKQARRDRRSDYSPPTPLTRSLSLPRPTQKITETYHVVALTSTTLGSLKIGHHYNGHTTTHLAMENEDQEEEAKQGKEDVPGLAVEIFKAKAWSTTMEQRIARIPPRTPTLTPPDEPEIINTWELMEGLDDSSPFRIPPAIGVDRSFSFHAFSDNSFPSKDGAAFRLAKTVPNSVPHSGAASPSPVSRLQMSPDDSLFSDFDPDIISSFRKAMAELSPQKGSFTLRPSKPPKPPPPPRRDPEEPNSDKPPPDTTTGIVKARVSEFQEKIDKKRLQKSQSRKFPPGGEDKVVIYFTSLRGVRKTYEDCCGVRLILSGYGVRVDERDVSMHQRFKDELYELVGGEGGGGGWRLPRLFVKGRDMGGAEEVMQLHEAGELEEILRGCDKVEERGGAACGACGDVRFVNCETCYGSCKVYFEDEKEEGGEFQRCPDCNENGIIRCPLCCC